MKEINTAGYVDGRPTSSRDIPSAIAARLVDEYLSLFASRTIFLSREDEDDVRENTSFGRL